jgi:hypothetical protein
VDDLAASYFVGATVAQLGCGAALPADAPLVCTGSKIFGIQRGVTDIFWLYHMGDDAYRVLPLSSGLALAPETTDPGAAVTQQRPSPQRWRLAARADGDGFAVSPVVGGAISWELGSDGKVVLAPSATGSEPPRWAFDEVATL